MDLGIVEFQPAAFEAYADAYFGLLESLERLFGRRVDLVVGSAIKNPYYDMTEEDLRASSVLKRATRALRQGGVSDEEIEAYTKEATLLLQPPDVHHHDVGADIVRSALGSLDRC